MKRYAVTEAQLNTNGAIAHINLDHGTDEAAAKSHYHMALASGLISGLVAVTVTMTVMDDESGMGFSQSETVKGTGTYTPPAEEGSGEE